MAVKITKDSLAEAVASGKPVVVDFWAEWCGPCRMIGPIIEELATQYEGKVIVGKCDVDENQDVAAQFGVRNIPTVVFMKGGEVVDKQIGAASKAILEGKITQLL